MKLSSVLTFVLLIAAIGFGFSACKKDRTCKATIILQDAVLKTPVEGREVLLTCDPTVNVANGPCIIEKTDISLTDGTVRFEFAEPSILKIYIDGVQMGYVELKAGEVVEKTVEL